VRRRTDGILDKITREGLHSLSDDEKRTLANATERWTCALWMSLEMCCWPATPVGTVVAQFDRW